MKSGVYVIQNLRTNKVYVGSAVDFVARKRVHMSQLRNGRHHCAHLQSAWDKEGAGAFEFKPIIVCSVEQRLMYEQIAIDAYDACNRERGYNAAPTAGGVLGYKHTEESRAKIREKRAKQTFSAETRKMWSENRTGRKMPDWFGPFISQMKKGQTHTPEARKKISEAQRGRVASLKTIESRSKLKAAQVIEIFKRARAGETQSSIAASFSIHQSTVSAIATGQNWAKVTKHLVFEGEGNA